MCKTPGTAMLRFDREGRKLYGVVTCGCGERQISIPATADGDSVEAIEYEPNPDLKPGNKDAGSPS